MERGNMQLTLPIDFPIFLERTNGNHIIYIYNCIYYGP